MQTKTVSKKYRPVKIKTSEKNYETYKSTSAAKLETLRRKTIRNLKQGKI